MFELHDASVQTLARQTVFKSARCGLTIVSASAPSEPASRNQPLASQSTLLMSFGDCAVGNSVEQVVFATLCGQDHHTELAPMSAEAYR